MMFQGKGAGSLPTAAAVLSDVIEIASASNHSRDLT
jgi:homoserine dehydrogenase